MKRKNKSKPEIIVDIKASQEADRKRKIVREVIFPFLLELNDNIGYTKVFLQASSTGIESVFNEKQREIKVADLIPRLTAIFTGNKANNPEAQKYMRLYEILKDESVMSFRSMVQELPRYIETYFTQQTDKNPVLDIPIDKILG